MDRISDVRMWLGLSLALLGDAGCGDDDSDGEEHPLVGAWGDFANSVDRPEYQNCRVGLGFASDGRYALTYYCELILQRPAFVVQTEVGTYTQASDRLTLVAERSSCSGKGTTIGTYAYEFFEPSRLLILHVPEADTGFPMVRFDERGNFQLSASRGEFAVSRSFNAGPWPEADNRWGCFASGSFVEDGGSLTREDVAFVQQKHAF